MSNKGPSFLRKQIADLEEMEKTAVEGTAAIIEGEEIQSPAEEPEDRQEPEVKSEEEAGAITPKEVEDQKYKVLQGKYEAETAQLRGMVQSLQEVVKTLTAGQPVKPEKKEDQKKDVKPAIKKISEDGLEDYEPKIADMIRDHNAQIDLISELKSEIADLRNSHSTVQKQVETVGSVVAQSSEDSFWTRVRSVVEDFDDINGENGNGADPRWETYLNGIDPVSHLKRRDIAGAIIKTKNPAYLVDLVNDFKRVTGYKNEKKKSKLESQIVPGVGGGGKAVGSNILKKVSEADYNKAYKARMFGRMSEADFIKIEEAYYKQQGGS